MNKHKYLIIAIIFMLTLVGLWKKYLPRELLNQTPQKIITQKDTPDSYMEGITFFEFNQHGKLKQKITSPRAIHFQRHNRLAYDNPRIIVYSQSGGNWQITSKQGQSRNGSKIIELINNVVVHRNKSKNNPETTAKTQWLTAMPRRNLLTSNKKVTIKQPHLTITGFGLKGNLKTGQLKTLRNTQTIYNPKA